MGAGRPTKYNEEIQAAADDYVETWSDDDAIPSRVGLCCRIGIAKHTSFAWEEKYPQFSSTLKEIEAMQEREAMNKGITGIFNPTIVKLVLANHGYSERQDINHSSSDGSMTPPQPVYKVVKE